MPGASARSSVLAVLLTGVTLILGCALPENLGTEAIDCLVIPPEIHPVLTALRPESKSTWTARWYDAEGAVHEMQHISKPIVITLSETGVTPVLLFEETDLPGFSDLLVHPAGALFPTQAAKGSPWCVLRPTRASGTAARCAEQVILGASGGKAAGRALVSSFDWPRLSALADSLSCPEAADTGNMAERILEGSFSSRYVTEMPSFFLKVGPDPQLIPGECLYPSLSGLPAIPIQEGGYADLTLRDGLNRFFTSRGVFDLQASEDEIVCTFFRSYD